MKSTVYILLAIMLSSILFSAFPNTKTNQTQTINIECIDDTYNSSTLEQSANILLSRLADCGIQTKGSHINNEEGSINIRLMQNIPPSALTALLTSKGQIGFYETLSRDSIIPFLQEYSGVLSKINIPSGNLELTMLSSEAVLGFINPEDRNYVSSELQRISLKAPFANNIKFCFSNKPSTESAFEVFILKNNFCLNNSRVEECTPHILEDKTALLNINFDVIGADIWSTTTKENIGKAIAIVLDNEVLYAPRVMGEIFGGKCQITGSFSREDAIILSSLINNEELPLDFKINN